MKPKFHTQVTRRFILPLLTVVLARLTAQFGTAAVQKAKETQVVPGHFGKSNREFACNISHTGAAQEAA